VSNIGFIILAILFLIDLFEIFLNILNIKQLNNMTRKPTEKLLSIYGENNLKKSLDYQKEKTKLSIYNNIFNIPVFYGIFLTGILANYLNFINNNFSGDVLKGILFFISFILFTFFTNLPFSLYDTFVIEKKYNFSKITFKLFIRDTILGGIVSFVLVSILAASVISFIKFTGNLWWIYASVFTVLFSLFLTYIYPSFIAPLFNKFQPLEEGELKDKIFEISQKADFSLENVYKMDASKRTTHSNAYFTGIGKKKRIVLFDTLLKKHSAKEIISILAHELGHFKLGHIKKMLFLSSIIITAGFFGANTIINQNFIYTAFSFPKSVYIGLFICTILFSPVNFIIQPFLSALSRKHEFEADKFGVKLTNDIDTFMLTLKKLYKDNLANPLPHHLYKTFYYSHPTLLERITELEELKQ
jgi:STE24 endopeptidase